MPPSDGRASSCLGSRGFRVRPSRRDSGGFRLPRVPGAPRARRPLRPLVVLLVALLSAACSDLTGIEELRSGFSPPATYRSMWSSLETCSGRDGDFDRIRWFWIRSFPAERPILGQWNERHEITLSVTVLRNRTVVAHEMLHDLLEGDPKHGDPAWEACGLPTGEG